jgi:hypothetical protein
MFSHTKLSYHAGAEPNAPPVRGTRVGRNAMAKLSISIPDELLDEARRSQPMLQGSELFQQALRALIGDGARGGRLSERTVLQSMVRQWSLPPELEQELFEARDAVIEADRQRFTEGYRFALRAVSNWSTERIAAEFAQRTTDAPMQDSALWEAYKEELDQRERRGELDEPSLVVPGSMFWTGAYRALEDLLDSLVERGNELGAAEPTDPDAEIRRLKERSNAQFRYGRRFALDVGMTLDWETIAGIATGKSEPVDRNDILDRLSPFRQTQPGYVEVGTWFWMGVTEGMKQIFETFQARPKSALDQDITNPEDLPFE